MKTPKTFPFLINPSSRLNLTWVSEETFHRVQARPASR